LVVISEKYLMVRNHAILEVPENTAREILITVHFISTKSIEISGA